MKFVDTENSILFTDIHSHILRPALKNTLNAIREYEHAEIYIDTLDLSNKSQKRWFYHEFVTQFCVIKTVQDYAGKVLKYNQVVYVFDNSHSTFNEIFHSKTQNIEAYKKLVDKIKTVLPFNILQVDPSWCQLMYWSEDKESGEYQELLVKAKALLKRNFNKQFTYEKAKKFCKTNGLTFLHEKYFNDVFNKQKLLIT